MKLLDTTVYAGNPNMASEIIFPQDIRNCTSCHDKTTSGTWKTSPSRLACNSCHGGGRDFSPDKVHNISNPYKPPYPREPE